VLTGLLNTLLVICSIVLIFLVLIQRGKGGGLAGAFGGVGGSSAFGTKAGDVFTKVTMYVAGTWIVLSMVLVILSNRERTSDWDRYSAGGTGAAQKALASPGKNKNKTTGSASDGKVGTGSKGIDIEEAPPGQAPAPKPTIPSQPANPGDPLAPLPSSDKTP
jgi:preprotein translocase subunit SecG